MILISKQNITKDSFVVQNLNRALQSNNAVLQRMSLNVLKSQTENVSAFLPSLISLTLLSEESEDVADVVLNVGTFFTAVSRSSVSSISSSKLVIWFTFMTCLTNFSGSATK